MTYTTKAAIKAELQTKALVARRMKRLADAAKRDAATNWTRGYAAGYERIFGTYTAARKVALLFG